MLAPWAAEYVGIPYRFGGLARDGADCWGLVRLVLAEKFGKELPAFARQESQEELSRIADEARATLGAESVEMAEPGDILLLSILGLPSHVGVVVGDGYMLHTLGTLQCSALERYTSPRWAPRVRGVYRV